MKQESNSMEGWHMVSEEGTEEIPVTPLEHTQET